MPHVVIERLSFFDNSYVTLALSGTPSAGWAVTLVFGAHFTVLIKAFESIFGNNSGV